MTNQRSIMTALPQAYAALNGFVPLWAFPSEDERAEAIRTGTAADFQAFYDAFLPRFDDALKDLDAHLDGDASGEWRTLRYLALGFAEVAPHVELYAGSPTVPYSFDPRRVRAHHGADID